ncbi:MAG: 16S rRNA (cytosine(1402)-N(4))-methyltransferase RsmH [Flavobacteriales bacterium]
MSSTPYHVPVLLQESIDGLALTSEGIYLDLTYGGGGHSREILNQLEGGKLFAFDQDKEAFQNLPDDSRFKLLNQNFKYLKTALLMYGIKQVDGILADLGVSSHQFDTAERGFSFRFDAELDMRMNKQTNLTAKDILNTYSADELTRVFSRYGEVYNSKSLAQRIIKTRTEHEIGSTEDLVNILQQFTNARQANKYYAQVFQALRIEVNQEMEALEQFLLASSDLVKPGGRLSIITYHSLEDRLVKRYIQSGNFRGEVETDMFGKPLVPFKKVNKKPILPTDSELELNSRSRSAKLRIAEKL